MSDFILIKNPSISNRFFYKQMLQKRGKEKKNNVTSIYKRSARLFYNRLFYKRKK